MGSSVAQMYGSTASTGGCCSWKKVSEEKIMFTGQRMKASSSKVSFGLSSSLVFSLKNNGRNFMRKINARNGGFSVASEQVFGLDGWMLNTRNAVMASNGYPGSYKKGTLIPNVEESEKAVPCVKIFHAGTALDLEGNLVAVGGRVLGVTAKGDDLREARDRAYQAVEKINWREGFYRRDIGWRALS